VGKKTQHDREGHCSRSPQLVPCRENISEIMVAHNQRSHHIDRENKDSFIWIEELEDAI